MEGPRNHCWLVDSSADVHVCNDRSLITEYKEQPTSVGGSTSNRVSPGRWKVRLRLGQRQLRGTRPQPSECVLPSEQFLKPGQPRTSQRQRDLPQQQTGNSVPR